MGTQSWRSRRLRAITAMGLAITAFSALVFAQHPIAQMESGDATVRGAVVLTGNKATLMSGAQISGGGAPATLRLERGGELRVCSRAAVTLTASADGKAQLVALNEGAVETHYSLAGNADVIMTPDFRLQLPGPGEFHFAVGLSAQGATCIAALKGDTASLIVSELMGDGTYQVKPGEHVIFTNGSVANADTQTLGNCGCAAPVKPAVAELGFPEEQSRQAATAIASGGSPPEAPALPGITAVSQRPDDVHVQVEAPMIFSPSTKPIAPPPPAPNLARVSFSPPVFPAVAPVTVQPPKPKKSWLQRFGSAIANIFK